MVKGQRVFSIESQGVAAMAQQNNDEDGSISESPELIEARSNFRTTSNVHVRDIGVPPQRDERFRQHVRGRAALSCLLERIYISDARTTGQLARQAEHDGHLSGEQAAEAQGLRHHCGRRDYRSTKMPNGRYQLVYIRCRCTQFSEGNSNESI